MEQRDPIEIVNEAAELFSQTFNAFQASVTGYMERIYKPLGLSYEAAEQFLANPDQYEQFAQHKFFESSRQKPKPKPKNVMKSVLYFATNATDTRSRNRQSRYAKVLDKFLREKIPADQVAERLRAAGGIEKLYRALCPGSAKSDLSVSEKDHGETEGSPKKKSGETRKNNQTPVVLQPNLPPPSVSEQKSGLRIATKGQTQPPEDAIIGKAAPAPRSNLATLAVAMPLAMLNGVLSGKGGILLIKVSPAGSLPGVQAVALRFQPEQPHQTLGKQRFSWPVTMTRIKPSGAGRRDETPQR